MEHDRRSRLSGFLLLASVLVWIAGMSPQGASAQSACDPDPNDCWNPACAPDSVWYLRWFEAFDWAINPNLNPLVAGPHVSDGGQAGAVTAMTTWDSEIASAEFDPTWYVDAEVNTDYDGSWSGNQENAVGWSTTWPMDEIDAAGRTWRASDGPAIHECDTFFNQINFSWDYLPAEPNPAGWTMDIESISLHEFGHWLAHRHPGAAFPAHPCNQQQCVMPTNWSDRIRRTPCPDEEYGANLLYAWTGVEDLREFLGYSADGSAWLEWSLWPHEPYDVRLYGSESGAPLVLLYEEESTTETYFSYADMHLINDTVYTYLLWLEDEFAEDHAVQVTPTGAEPTVRFSYVSCGEVSDGIEVQWATTSELPALDGFDIYRATGWEWTPSGWRHTLTGLDDFTQVNSQTVAAYHAPHVYAFLDATAYHGRQYAYLLYARWDEQHTRCGPACNPCWRPYLPSCSLGFDQPQPYCPEVCPAGDADVIRMQVTLRDSCGFPVEQNDDIFVWVVPSTGENFRLCCPEEETVQSAQVALPNSPTDDQGTAAVDIRWAGGGDTLLSIAAYIGTEQQIPGALQAQVMSPDLNGDCVVDVQDSLLFQSYVGMGAWQADYDCSGRVTKKFDGPVFNAHYGHACAARAGKLEAEARSPGAAGWFTLAQNSPNPFNPITRFRYAVPDPGATIAIAVLDLSGRRVKTLVSEWIAAGQHEVAWDGRDDGGQRVASGVYFYLMEAPGFREQRKLVVLK